MMVAGAISWGTKQLLVDGCRDFVPLSEKTVLKLLSFSAVVAAADSAVLAGLGRASATATSAAAAAAGPGAFTNTPIAVTPSIDAGFERAPTSVKYEEISKGFSNSSSRSFSNAEATSLPPSDTNFRVLAAAMAGSE
jgi:hypothetical protein